MNDMFMIIIVITVVIIIIVITISWLLPNAAGPPGASARGERRGEAGVARPLVLHPYTLYYTIM